MKLKSIAAAFIIAAVPLCAQAQKPPKATKADAEKVVKLISADKAKTEAYCEMNRLGEQIDQAEQKKDSKTSAALSQKMDELSQEIGPEYIALMDGMQDLDPNSKAAQDIGASLESLDKLCGK